LFQKGDSAKQVDLRAGVPIPRDQILGFGYELFSILESALLLALLCFLKEGGSFFPRFVNVRHVESLCRATSVCVKPSFMYLTWAAQFPVAP